MLPLITENTEKIAAICRAHHVRRLAIFGSAVRDDFNPATSDIDLLVDFSPLSELEYAPNYFDLLDRLDQLFGRRVDLVSSRFIRNPFFRRAVERDQVELYAA